MSSHFLLVSIQDAVLKSVVIGTITMLPGSQFIPELFGALPLMIEVGT